MVKHICQVPKVYDCPRHRWDANEVSHHRGEKSDVDDSCLTGVAAVSVEMEVMVAAAAVPLMQ